MNGKELEYFKNIILDKRREVLESEGVETVGGNKSADESDSGDLRYATHLADIGSETMGKELNSYFSARAGKYLKHLDAALARIERGTYGICLKCGKEIPHERLQEVPHTRHCVPCKSQEE